MLFLVKFGFVDSTLFFALLKFASGEDTPLNICMYAIPGALLLFTTRTHLKAGTYDVSHTVRIMDITGRKKNCGTYEQFNATRIGRNFQNSRFTQILQRSFYRAVFRKMCTAVHWFIVVS